MLYGENSEQPRLFPENSYFMGKVQELRIDQNGLRLEQIDCLGFPDLLIVRYTLNTQSKAEFKVELPTNRLLENVPKNLRSYTFFCPSMNMILPDTQILDNLNTFGIPVTYFNINVFEIEWRQTNRKLPSTIESVEAFSRLIRSMYRNCGRDFVRVDLEKDQQGLKPYKFTYTFSSTVLAENLNERKIIVYCSIIQKMEGGYSSMVDFEHQSRANQT